MRASPEREYDESSRGDLGAHEGGSWGRLDAKAQAAGRATLQQRADSRAVILPQLSKSYRRPVLSHCGPLQRRSRSAAFLLRAVASGRRHL
jgi:hypothetical protein